MIDLSLIESIEDCTLFGGTFPNERIEEAIEFFREQKAALYLRGISRCKHAFIKHTGKYAQCKKCNKILQMKP